MKISLVHSSIVFSSPTSPLQSRRGPPSQASNGKEVETPLSDFNNADTVGSTSSRFDRLDKKKVFKMQTAIRLNALIKENSADSQLTIITLPKAPRGDDGGRFYLSFVLHF